MAVRRSSRSSAAVGIQNEVGHVRLNRVSRRFEPFRHFPVRKGNRPRQVRRRYDAGTTQVRRRYDNPPARQARA